MVRYPNIVDVHCEPVYFPFLFVFERCEMKCIDEVPIVSGLLSIDYGVVAIDPQGPVIRLQRESDGLPVNLFLPLCESKQLNDSSHSKRHSVRILPVGNV